MRVFAHALTAVIGVAIPFAIPAADADTARLELGRKVFMQIAQPPCGLCHTLADAGAKGEIGAKLDEIQPDEQRVMAAVRQGVGVMPRYDDTLSPAQIEAVARYVARAVKRAK